MNWQAIIDEKIHVNSTTIMGTVETWRNHNEKVVFTNGCFDILHLGHLDYLAKAADLGDRLIIGLNSDESVQLLKGKSRPVFNWKSRATKLASLVFVDAVVQFTEETPLNLISSVLPDVLVKGGDYTIESIVGAAEVLKQGGEVQTIPFLDGYSSTLVIEKIKKG